MPRTKSAAKSYRTSLRRAAENAAFKARLKLALKRANKGNLADVLSLLDKAASRHIVHKNKAARLKSRLVKRVGISGPKTKKRGAIPKSGKRQAR